MDSNKIVDQLAKQRPLNEDTILFIKSLHDSKVEILQKAHRRDLAESLAREKALKMDNARLENELIQEKLAKESVEGRFSLYRKTTDKQLEEMVKEAETAKQSIALLVAKTKKDRIKNKKKKSKKSSDLQPLFSTAD